MSTAPAYKRAGRGGAGNYFEKAAAKEVDIESQAPSQPRQTTSDATAGAGPAPLLTSFVDTIYKTIGRGGAGNWFVQDEAQSPTTTSTASPANASIVAASRLPDPTETVNTDSSSRVWTGRGGAGNWEADQMIKRRASKQIGDRMEQELQDMSRKQAEEDAIEMVPKPTHAHVHMPLQPVQDLEDDA